MTVYSRMNVGGSLFLCLLFVPLYLEHIGVLLSQMEKYTWVSLSTGLLCISFVSSYFVTFIKVQFSFLI